MKDKYNATVWSLGGTGENLFMTPFAKQLEIGIITLERVVCF